MGKLGLDVDINCKSKGVKLHNLDEGIKAAVTYDFRDMICGDRNKYKDSLKKLEVNWPLPGTWEKYGDKRTATAESPPNLLEIKSTGAGDSEAQRQAKLKAAMESQKPVVDRLEALEKKKQEQEKQKEKLK